MSSHSSILTERGESKAKELEDMAEAGVDIDENIEVLDVSDYKPKNIPSPTGTFILGLFRLDSFPDTP